jgi:hypothetical protein
MKGQLAQVRAEQREIVAELGELEGRVGVLQLPGTRLRLVDSKETDDAQRFGSVALAPKRSPERR